MISEAARNGTYALCAWFGILSGGLPEDARGAVQELAGCWDISEATIYARIQDHPIDPVVRLGARGQIRIPRTTILRMEGRLDESDGITEVKSPNTTEPDAVAADAPDGGRSER